MSKEIWKDVKGYEGLYKVSSNGRIKSFPRILTMFTGEKYKTKKRILKPAILNTKYSQVCLVKNGHKKKQSVHRLVGMSFIPNPKNKREINHKNGIKSDNRVKNLEWVTTSENQLHSYSMGLSKPSFSNRKPVAQIGKNGKIIRKFKSVLLAAKYFNPNTKAGGVICYSIKNNKKYYKYNFKYI